MEYVQERVTTIHDLGGRVPDSPAEETCVVVPLSERDHASLAAERTLSELASFDPGRVIVALRASRDAISMVDRWLDTFDLPLDVLWCDAPATMNRLDQFGLNGSAGKGRDVWLALGAAANTHEYVAVHDADSTTFARDDLARLLSPLETDISFVKGYYARVENRRLYGRLFRLFYVPLVRALRELADAPILQYLDAFRYGLSGEFAATAEFVQSMRAERRFGLEVSTLGEAFDHAGFEHSAQVDLGRYEHDHRAVGGPSGLAEMAEEVADALLRVIHERDVTPDYELLPETYRETATRLIDQYAADASLNGFEYDRTGEYEQVDAYAGAIAPPGDDDRMPAWRDVELDPADILADSRTALLEHA